MIKNPDGGTAWGRPGLSQRGKDGQMVYRFLLAKLRIGLMAVYREDVL
jgi:hypothetical protein